MSYKLNKLCKNNERFDFVVNYNHNQGLQLQDGAELVDGTYVEFTYALLPNEAMFSEEVEIEVPERDENGEIIGTYKESVILSYPVTDPDYEVKQAQKEAERIAHLKLTGADVERGIYQAKGMVFEDVVAFVTANLSEGLDVKALKIELKANHFYRGNPYVNAVGALLGFTSVQLDKFFETNDWTWLLPLEESSDDENSEAEEIPQSQMSLPNDGAVDENEIQQTPKELPDEEVSVITGENLTPTTLQPDESESKEETVSSTSGEQDTEQENVESLIVQETVRLEEEELNG